MAAAAGVAALGAKGTFEYNRENFLYDRMLRMKKEFKVQEFKVEQAKLWREDVRDLISLTEYKMHVYLLVNVLLLGHTVVLWCQGRLPQNSPDWLMMGHAIATAGAFMFLLLSIWMAMHAAVAAQSYEARLLTQLVRLPIPSWQEIEACRTYASEFEELQPKHMFRVPFLMGRQEDLVRGPPLDPTFSAPAQLPASSAAPLSPTSSTRGLGRRSSAAAVHADPWGLERRGDHIYELGCKYGSDVAHLRHVKIARQAMVHWQSYDAFARISMSMGVDQLLLAMSYYMLGYVLVEVGSRMAATYGVILLTAISETLVRLDMSLSMKELRLLQVLLAVGPLCSTVAAYRWAEFSRESWEVAEALVVVAFFAHASFLAVISHLARVDSLETGVMLPKSFSSVLYLDVFGWLKQADAVRAAMHRPLIPGTPGDGDGTSAYSASEAADSAFSEQWVREVADADDDMDDEWEASPGSRTLSTDSVAAALAAAARRRPALGAVRFDAEGRPLPTRPQDLVPPGAVDDLRHLPGAPVLSGEPNPTELDARFYDAGSWMRSKRAGWEIGTDEEESHGAPIVTGHEGEAPRMLPWQIFTVAMRSLCVAWALAGGYYAVRLSWEGIVEASWEPAPLLQASGAKEGASLLGLTSPRVSLQRLFVSWPYAETFPRTLACDAAGRRFVASDGLSLFEASLSAEGDGLGQSRPPAQIGLRGPPSRRAQPPSLSFRELLCGPLEGEGVQDAAVACAGREYGQIGDCEALVLHRHGRRVAGCPLSGARKGAEEAFLANVSDAWLERLRQVGTHTGGRWDEAPEPHSRVEKAVAISSDAECGGDSPAQRWRSCALLGTTLGRVVQVQHSRARGQMVPQEILAEGPTARGIVPGGVRMVAGSRLGVLHEGGRGLAVLSSALGEDGFTGGNPLWQLRLPKQAEAGGFCVGGGFVYILGKGAGPKMWRLRLPPGLRVPVRPSANVQGA